MAWLDFPGITQLRNYSSLSSLTLRPLRPLRFNHIKSGRIAIVGAGRVYIISRYLLNISANPPLQNDL